jgi:membrane dipeptidase
MKARVGFLIVAAAALVVPAAHATIPEAIALEPVVDLHVDLSYRVNYEGGTLAGGSGQMVGTRARAAGVSGVVLPLFVPYRVSPTGPRPEDLESSYARLMELIPKTAPYSLAGCEAREFGAIHTWFAFEGSAPLAADEGAVDLWVKRGARLFGLVHTTDNVLATSSTNRDPKAKGLSELGRAFVKRVHRAGAIIDVSHSSDATIADVVAIALEDGVPVVATHSNARALAPNRRNLTDDQLRAIAKTGGIVGVNFHSPFLVPSGRAHLKDVVRHIRHIMTVAGKDHVAIGSDFEGDITPPIGLESAERFPDLVRALNKAGVVAEVPLILSGNALRILCPAKPAR